VRWFYKTGTFFISSKRWLVDKIGEIWIFAGRYLYALKPFYPDIRAGHVLPERFLTAKE
jgi:hypothetical protein